MPRRANLAAAIQDLPFSQQNSQAENLAILRTQWRWAAFSQFFFTFFPLFTLNYVSVADIEQDLVSNTRQVLPRIMQKLLYTLSYDRKVSIDNWQTALRKQYNKRAPHTNPFGLEPLSSVPLRKDVMRQDAEKSISVQADDAPNVSERGLSIIDTVASLEGFTPTAFTPLNDFNSTRQSSVVEDQHAPRTSKDIDLEVYPEQKSIDWFDLPMLAKLESMHTVAEWQFQNPTKLRTIMKNDDEFATWRIEPIGYDSKGNAYWLIGADRLWIQRARPKAPKSKALKRKKPPPRASEMLSIQNAKRLRISSPEKPSATLPTISTPSSNRYTRAAKDQAKRRLGAQAKESAELNRQAALTNSRTRNQASLRSVSTPTPLVVGTRSSARLRGTQDDEWQPIPEEWLKEVNQTRTSRRSVAKTGLETDEESVSELTELSEDASESLSVSLKWELNGHNEGAEGDKDDRFVEQESPEDFVEWETICSTLQDWEQIAERFERATHYTEKALCKVLVNDIVPVITHELREIERKRHLEEAIVHRKRSSRIALRESEKEEARMSSMKKQEEDEKMSRARRFEARKQREEEERIKREHAREQRRKEREEKEETGKAQLEAEEARALVQAERAAKKRKTISPAHDTPRTKANGKNTSSGSRTPIGEDWELACEICNRQGVNLDDGTPMMSCGVCSRWQHIQCHDRADRMAGRPRRNWNSEEFTCSSCRATQRVQYNNNLPDSKQVPSQNSRQAAPFQAYPSSHLNMPSSSSSIYHQDYRSPHYLSGYNNPSLQNQNGRPNGQQYPNAQYSSSLAGHSILSFSHYQPSQHAFLASAPTKTPHPNAQSLYTNTNNSNNAFPQYRHDYVDPETSTWSPSAAQSPGNSVPISTFMPSQIDNRNLQAVHTYSNHEPQTSYTRYSTDNHSTGSKKPVPYPTSSRP